MVDLTELVRALGTEVNHQRATKVVLDLDQVTSHLAIAASNEFLGELAELCLVCEVALGGFGK